MGLPRYFQRSAVAAAQVVGGFDEAAIRARLGACRVGVGISAATLDLPEGAALADLLIRLLARLYPTLYLPSDGHLNALRELARAINPEVEIVSDRADVAVSIGDAQLEAHENIFVGCNGWDAYVSSTGPVPIGTGSNPLGAGAAACLAAANVFRSVFLDGSALDESLVFSTLDLEASATAMPVELGSIDIGASNVLVGLGAVGQGTVWTLNRLPLVGRLHLVDPEVIELSNLQRYVLATEADVGGPKTDAAKASLPAPLEAIPHRTEWAAFAAEHGTSWDRAIVCLDSARDRRAVQASLPRWIANAWTQPGDLGVSLHPWGTTGACLSCIYLPVGEGPSEDRLIAEALGIANPSRELQIRQLLYANSAPPREMLVDISASLGLPLDSLLPFESKPLRSLYVEGVCGGAVIPLDRIGTPRQDVHVPLAHQSALAGVLLAGRLVAHAIGRAPDTSKASRINVLQPIGAFVTQEIQKDPRGICICQDGVYRHAYDLKYRAPGTRGVAPILTTEHGAGTSDTGG